MVRDHLETDHRHQKRRKEEEAPERGGLAIVKDAEQGRADDAESSPGRISRASGTVSLARATRRKLIVAKPMVAAVGQSFVKPSL